MTEWHRAFSLSIPIPIRVQPAQRDLIGIGISDTVEHHESQRSPASGLLPRAERMVGVHVFRSMSFGMSAEMTLPRWDR
jgi:hypothetical protein